MRDIGWIGRREVMRLLGVGGAALAAGLPDARACRGREEHAGAGPRHQRHDHVRSGARGAVHAAADADRRVRIAGHHDARRLPQREAGARHAWARTPDGKGWRFTLRDGREVQQRQPGHRRGREVVARPGDATSRTSRRNTWPTSTGSRSSIRSTIDVIMKDPAAPMLTVLCGPTNGIMERKVVEAHGGTAAAERQYRGQGDQLAEPELRRRRRLHAGRLDPQRADPADPQPALLARPGAVRARGDPPHERQRDAVAGGQARRHRRRVQSDPGTGGNAEGRCRMCGSRVWRASTSSTWR